MIKMEITFGSYAEAAIAMSALANMGMAVKGGANITVGAAAKTAVGAAEKVAVTAGKPEPDAKAPSTPQEPLKADGEGIPYLKVKQAIADAAADPAKRPEVVKLLAKFGAARGTDLKAEQYAGFLDGLKALA